MMTATQIKDLDALNKCVGRATVKAAVKLVGVEKAASHIIACRAPEHYRPNPENSPA